MVADPLRFALMPLPALAYRLIGRFSVSRVDRTLHPFLYRLTGGRGVLGHVLGCEMLLLTTRGRRTGKPRTVALFAFPVVEPANSWAVIGSRGGSGGIPSWYRNLVAVPDAEIQIRRQRRSVRTRPVRRAARSRGAGGYDRSPLGGCRTRLPEAGAGRVGGPAPRRPATAPPAPRQGRQCRRRRPGRRSLASAA